MYRVEQRSLAGRARANNPSIDILRVSGERHLELRAAAKFHQEKFILGVRSLEKSGGRLGNFFHFVPHAAAGVQEQTH